MRFLTRQSGSIEAWSAHPDRNQNTDHPPTWQIHPVAKMDLG
jgi:hypothetical protein